MIHTRENMSQELREELDLIEIHERRTLAKDEIDTGIGEFTLYMSSTFGPKENPGSQALNPFEIKLVWDRGFGVLLKMDFKQEIIESLDSYNSPDLFKTAANSMRELADELDWNAARIEADQ